MVVLHSARKRPKRSQKTVLARYSSPEINSSGIARKQQPHLGYPLGGLASGKVRPYRRTRRCCLFSVVVPLVAFGLHRLVAHAHRSPIRIRIGVRPRLCTGLPFVKAWSSFNGHPQSQPSGPGVALICRHFRCFSTQILLCVGLISTFCMEPPPPLLFLARPKGPPLFPQAPGADVGILIVFLAALRAGTCPRQPSRWLVCLAFLAVRWCFRCAAGGRALALASRLDGWFWCSIRCRGGDLPPRDRRFGG